MFLKDNPEICDEVEKAIYAVIEAECIKEGEEVEVKR